VITCVVHLRHNGFVLRTLSPGIYRKYIITADSSLRISVFHIMMGVFEDLQTLDKLHCGTCQLSSLTAELGVYTYLSLTSIHASFDATRANQINVNISESTCPWYARIRQEVANAAISSSLPWAV
jgi:hypothetical protein